MSSAFGHAIVVSERPAQRVVPYTPPAPNRRGREVPWRTPPREIWKPGCAYCDQEPRYVASYRYVTGRKGRVTSRVQSLCEEHGRRFAEKHGLELPELPARAKLTIIEIDAEL